MNGRDLRYFVTIMDSGGFGAAAERLGISQPALTKCVDRLEDSLGAALFERKGRQARPTHAGEVLHRSAQAILLRMEETAREIRDHASGIRGHVRLGAAATMTETLMPSIIGRIMRQTPGITLDLMTAMNDVLRAALREDRLDLVVGPAQGREPEFDHEPILSDRVVVVARPGHPLASRRTVGLAQMLDYEWVLPSSSVVLRRWLDHSFERAGLDRPRLQVCVDSLVLMPKLIGGSDLLSFCSDRKLDACELVEIPCPDTTYERSFDLVFRAGSYRSPAALTVAGFLRDMAAEGMSPAVSDQLDGTTTDP